MVTQKKPMVLVVLDGFGYDHDAMYNAIYHAKKPNFNGWLKQYPHTFLKASGLDVGLLPNQIGNSEVGHLTIGSGRIIKQDVVRIINAIENGSFFDNEILKKIFTSLKKDRKRLHLMGLLSDAGIHSHTKICDALLQMAKDYEIESVFVHAFLDGRDVPPQSAPSYLKQLEIMFSKINLGVLGSIIGRIYAMDRDKNWDRTQQAYDMLTKQSQNIEFSSYQQALNYYYHQNITDEYIPPTLLNQKAIVHPGDGIIFFNFRQDRAQQLTAAFTDTNFKQFPTKKIKLAWFGTMTDYDHQQLKTEVIFKPQRIKNTLKEILQKHGKTLFSIAETEKYAHITYFFDGGNEKLFENETRVLIPSITVKNYIQHPEMSAQEITNAVILSLEQDPKDFYLINYANADMVGHSGNFQATVKAIEILDFELGRLYKEVVEKQDGTLILTADHGNAEQMFDPKTNQPKTSHTTNQVYFLILKKNLSGCPDITSLHGLADIAPYILKLMNIPVPKEMQNSLDS